MEIEKARGPGVVFYKSLLPGMARESTLFLLKQGIKTA
jgi:hypothetical protein